MRRRDHEVGRTPPYVDRPRLAEHLGQGARERIASNRGQPTRGGPVGDRRSGWPMLTRWWIVMIEPRAGRAERSEAVPHRSMCACGEEDPDDVRAGRDDSSISRLQPSEASRRRRQPFAQVFRAGSPMAAAAVAGSLPASSQSRTDTCSPSMTRSGLGVSTSPVAVSQGVHVRGYSGDHHLQSGDEAIPIELPRRDPPLLTRTRLEAPRRPLMVESLTDPTCGDTHRRSTRPHSSGCDKDEVRPTIGSPSGTGTAERADRPQLMRPVRHAHAASSTRFRAPTLS